jgi:hypothetical protein
MIRQLSALGVIVAALIGAWAWISQVAVKGERARVETTGAKISAKATTARQKAKADPHALDRYWRD